MRVSDYGGHIQKLQTIELGGQWPRKDNAFHTTILSANPLVWHVSTYFVALSTHCVGCCCEIIGSHTSKIKFQEKFSTFQIYYSPYLVEIYIILCHNCNKRFISIKQRAQDFLSSFPMLQCWRSEFLSSLSTYVSW